MGKSRGDLANKKEPFNTYGKKKKDWPDFYQYTEVRIPAARPAWGSTGPQSPSRALRSTSPLHGAHTQKINGGINHVVRRLFGVFKHPKDYKMTAE
jgi:hypothetical protein